jgi:hypothetical protein
MHTSNDVLEIYLTLTFAGCSVPLKLTAHPPISCDFPSDASSYDFLPSPMEAVMYGNECYELILVKSLGLDVIFLRTAWFPLL